MAIQIEKPEIKHKYISLFDTEAEFNAAYPNFEEVNWSDVAYPQERPDNYRVSRRLSNMYHKNTPPDYKFDDINDFVVEGDVTYYADGAYIGTFNEDDYTNGNIRKTFFLEIVWGYSGWEWHDYERIIGTNPETLKGGNLYKIKDIQTVPHIIDGHRLQHINDFLFSQYNVTRIEGFNTENLVAANRAFKRGTNDDTTYPKRDSSQILECHFVEGYNTDGTFGNHPFGYADPVTGESLLENLVEADGLFFNNKVYIYEGDFANVIPFTIPNIQNIDRLYSYGVYTNGLKFKMNNLTKLTNAFKMAIFPQDTINVNNIFIDNTLKNIDNFSGMFGGASFTGYKNVLGENTVEVKLDLTASNVPNTDIIDLSRFAEYAGPSEYQKGTYFGIAIEDRIILFDLNFSNKVDLSNAFASICRTKDLNYDEKLLRNNGFKGVRVDFNSKESYITSLKSAFANNTFIENLPVQQVPNNACDDSYIYQSCICNTPISYDFHNGTLASPRIQGWGQFNDCTFNSTFDFDPTHSSNKTLEYLDRVEFCGIKFGDNVPAADRAFPYVVQNQNDTTYRYFDMCASKFTSMNTQNIYIDTVRFRTESTKYDIGANSRRGGASTINPFDNCSEATDLSNINLYYSDVNDEAEVLVPSGTQFTLNFANCTNLIKSPHIHLFYKRISYVYFNLSFRELEYLEDVNLENLSAIGTGGNISIFDFQDCVALKNLRIGTNTTNGFRCSLDIRGCFDLNTPANIAVLKTTLDKLGDYTTLWIMESTWSAVNDNDIQTGYFVTKFTNMSVSVKRWDDATYVPGSPRN